MSRSYLAGHVICEDSAWTLLDEIPGAVSWRVFRLDEAGPFFVDTWTHHRNPEIPLLGALSYPKLLRSSRDTGLKTLGKALRMIDKYSTPEWIALSALLGRVLQRRVFSFLYADGDEYVAQAVSDGLTAAHVRLNDFQVDLADGRFSFAPIIHEEDPVPIREKVQKKLQARFRMARIEPMVISEPPWFSGGLIAEHWPKDVDQDVLDLLDEAMDEPGVLQERIIQVDGDDDGSTA